MTAKWQNMRLKIGRASSMIDEEHYVFPHDEPKRERTEAEQRQADETIVYLESLPFRPIGVEW